MQEDAADRLDAVFPGAMMAYVGPNEAFGSNGDFRAPEGAGKADRLNYIGRVSTVAVQRFCKPKVGGSNPSPGTTATRRSIDARDEARGPGLVGGVFGESRG